MIKCTADIGVATAPNTNLDMTKLIEASIQHQEDASSTLYETLS